MDYKKLKTSVNEIKLTTNQKAQIIDNCKKIYNQENKIMKKNTSIINFRKPLTAAATLAICLCLTVGAIAGFSGGFFRDITGPDGAVTGTEYIRPAEELTVTTEYENGKLMVSVAAADAAAAPYRYQEELAIKEYQIISSDNKTVFSGTETEYYDFTDGKAEIALDTDRLDTGNYTLVITEFSGAKKADGPLAIKGEWVCEFYI